MSKTCKECRWSTQATPNRDGREQCQCHLEPDGGICYADWWCSHFCPREDSPGTITLTRYATGETSINSCYNNNRELFEWMLANIPKGEHRVFRLVPVEEKS